MFGTSTEKRIQCKHRINHATACVFQPREEVTRVLAVAPRGARLRGAVVQYSERGTSEAPSRLLKPLSGCSGPPRLGQPASGGCLRRTAARRVASAAPDCRPLPVGPSGAGSRADCELLDLRFIARQRSLSPDALSPGLRSLLQYIDSSQISTGQHVSRRLKMNM